MRPTEVSDIRSLIDTLDGLAAAARFFGEKPQTVANWLMRGRIPSRLFMRHEAALKARSIKAPARLWGFDKPVGASEAEAAA